MSVIFNRLSVANHSPLDSIPGAGTEGYTFQPGVLTPQVRHEVARKCSGGGGPQRRMSRLILGLIAFSKTENKVAV